MAYVVTFHGTSHRYLLSLEDRIRPDRLRLKSHPLYKAITTLDHVRRFMETHVFAVWDFMCLLKSLQREITCVESLWFPTSHASSRRFINEIVLGEESDSFQGRTLSHYEIYLAAMERAGADTTAIDSVMRTVQTNRQDPALEESLRSAPPHAERFVRETLHVVTNGSLAHKAAAFTFGREDAIPEMFTALVRDLDQSLDGDLNLFTWYLERHIEVDADDHGPLARQMMFDICGDNPRLWAEATQAAEHALRSRLALWDGIYESIQTNVHRGGTALSI